MASSKTPTIVKSIEPLKIPAAGPRKISKATPTSGPSLERAADSTSVAPIVSPAGGATSRGRMM
jgi:hypothetical protein